MLKDQQSTKNSPRCSSPTKLSSYSIDKISLPTPLSSGSSSSSSFERMSARLCAMDTNHLPMLMQRLPMLLLLTTISSCSLSMPSLLPLSKVEFQRYGVPAAFRQRDLPIEAFGLLPTAMPTAMMHLFSNKIFNEDHTQLLLSLGYVQFEGDLRKFKITCPKDPNVFVIINTHVDDDGAILTWRSKYDETLRALSGHGPLSRDEVQLQLQHYVPLCSQDPGYLPDFVFTRAAHSLHDGPLRHVRRSHSCGLQVLPAHLVPQAQLRNSARYYHGLLPQCCSYLG